MKKLLILLTILSTLACNYPIPKEGYKKPFTIIGKCACSNCYIKSSEYTYSDVNGNLGQFEDDTDKYNIGQVIN